MTDLTTPPKPFNVGVPELDPSVVDRPRLVDALLAHVERERVVSIVGVAGAGKTTVAAQVAREASIPVGWVTVEDWDESPARFLKDLSAALGDAAPGVGGLGDATAYSDPRELAAAIGGMLGARGALLVVDDAHLLSPWQASAAVLGALLRTADGLRLMLVGRVSVAIPGVGVDVLARSVEIGGDLLAADVDEAADILAARGSDRDPEAAARESEGWVAGIVFESAGRFGVPSTGLASFLGSEVRPRLTPDEDAFLVRCAALDHVDPVRASALGGDEGPEMLVALRRAGLPGTWTADGALRMHPRIRELLREELDTGNAARRREALGAAARAFEQEGELELALESWIAAGAQSDARRLLPHVIGGIVSRLDVEQAQRLLDDVLFEEEPAEVLHARLALAALAQEVDRARSALVALEDDDRFARAVSQLPDVGALTVAILAEIGRVDDALARFEMIPHGRARDAARYYLSTERDDPDAPLPPFAGDMLDGMICSGLWYRGRLAELQRITSPVLAAVSGVPDLVGRAGVHRGPLAAGLARLADAVSARDLEAARSILADFERIDSGSHVFLGLVEAEIAIRIERDPARGLLGIARARALPEAGNVSYREWIGTLEGGALLLAGDHEAARDVLREALVSMRSGDRLLHVPAALVYLAEAEWRGGAEEAADRATAEAYACAREHGGISRLLLALADFPGVLSRALDLETASDGELHALGRALVHSSRGVSLATPGPVHVHVRELGEPLMLLDGVPVRPKLRKSLEVLSFLLSRPRASARRAEILMALWNGRDDDATRAYLRQAIRHLREALPDGVVLATRGDVLSLAGALTSEVTELEALLRAAAETTGPARRALYLDAIAIGRRGHFLEGSIGVAWVDERRESIEAALLAARLDAAATLIEETRLLEALAMTDEALQADPLLERGWRLRMQALGLLGDTDGVLDAFASCRSALAEVGHEPARATIGLARRLRG